MGARGPAPVREDERRRRNEMPASQKMGPAELQNLPFEVDLAPEPPNLDVLQAADQDIDYETRPDAAVGWHPYVQELWARLQRDPSRAWNGPAAMALDVIMCETLSRHLEPQVVGTRQISEGESEVIWGKVPMNGSTIASVMKWAAARGLYEQDRLRIHKEITFYSQADPAVQAAVTGNVVSIEKNRAAALGG